MPSQQQSRKIAAHFTALLPPPVSPAPAPQCLEVLVTLRRELERRALLQQPRVHVSAALGPETQRLREYVRRLQAELAERPGAGRRGSSVWMVACRRASRSGVGGQLFGAD